MTTPPTSPASSGSTPARSEHSGPPPQRPSRDGTTIALGIRPRPGARRSRASGGVDTGRLEQGVKGRHPSGFCGQSAAVIPGAALGPES